MDSTNSMTKAVIYARYSSHNQTEQSIEGQLHDAYEYALRNNYQVVAEYIDRAQSGTKDTRDSFQQMIRDAEKKAFQAIIVWKLDRFARNRYDSATYKAKLKKNGIRVVSVMEQINSNPEGIILEGLLESMAEYYSANLAENVKRGMRETAAKGRYCGGPIPYGYQVSDGRLIADPKTAPIVREVFERYASGELLTRICEDLDSRGYKSSLGKPIRIWTFARMLKNPTYIGHRIYNGQLVEQVADPIVSPEIFEKARMMATAHKRSPATSLQKVDYLLTGTIICGNCGMPMVAESGRTSNGTVYNYYSCRGRKRFKVCKKANEKKDLLEDLIIESTISSILQPDQMARIADTIVKQLDRGAGREVIQAAENKIARVEVQINNLIDALADAPKAARDRIYAKMEVLENEKAKMEVDLAQLRLAAEAKVTRQEVLSWLDRFAHGSTADPDYRKSIVRIFINCAYVFDDRIIVFYNICGQGKGRPSPESFDGVGECQTIRLNRRTELIIDELDIRLAIKRGSEY